MNVSRATISPKFYRFPPHNNFPYRPNDALCYGYCRPGQLAGEVDACPDCRANCILQLLQENMSKMNMHLASCSLYLAAHIVQLLQGKMQLQGQKVDSELILEEKVHECSDPPHMVGYSSL